MNKKLRCVAPVGALLMSIAAPGAQQAPVRPVDQSRIQFRSSVDLVRLSVTARDATGQIQRDLSPEEFEVYEDGVRQEISLSGHDETPISVVVLLDASGSMMGEKLMHAEDGVTEFVQALKPGDEALVIAFSDFIDALGRFGLDARTIERAVRGVDAGAGTRLYDAVIEGARAITRPDRKEKRAMLVLSDGQDTASVARIGDAVEAVRRAEVPVYAIAIEYGADSPLSSRTTTDPLWRQLRSASDIDPLHRLTDGTGGWTYSIPAARRCKDICLRVADELRNQYLLGYYPTNKQHDDGWRTIEVRTTRPGITLTTRDGYYAPPS